MEIKTKMQLIEVGVHDPSRFGSPPTVPGGVPAEPEKPWAYAKLAMGPEYGGQQLVMRLPSIEHARDLQLFDSYEVTIRHVA